MSIRQDEVQLKVIINGEQAGKTLKDLRNQARNLTRSLDQYEIGSDAYKQVEAELKKVNDELAKARAATRGMATEAGKARTPLQSVGDYLKKGAAAAAGFFAIERVTEWGKALVSWATKGTAALELSQRKTAIVFGDAISLVEDFAAINAQSLGVTEQQYASLATAIGDILVPMGFQRQEAAKLSSDLVNLSGALSEWSNGQRTAQEVSTILQKALTGEREGLKELGIVISEADVSSRLLAKGQKELTGSALQQAKAIATYELILERSRDAQTAFAAGQDTMAKSGNRIKAVFEQVKENILRGLLPAFRAIGNTVADIVAPLKRQSDILAETQAQFNVQIETLQNVNLSQENRRKLIEEINTRYKEYLPNLITEKTTLGELKTIQDQVNESFNKRITLLAAEESLRDVRADQIKTVAQELDLAQQLTKAQQELAKFDITRVGQGRESQDQAFIRASNEVQKYTGALEDNRKKQEELRAKFDQLSEAAKQLGLDVGKIFAPTTTTTTTNDDPAGDPEKILKERLAKAEELINRERQLRIKELDFLVLNEEQYNAQREIINLEADSRIARAQIDILKNSQAEKLALEQEIADNRRKIEDINAGLDLQQAIENINVEKELRLQAAREEAMTAQELQEQVGMITRQADIDIARQRLLRLEKGSTEYLAMARDIADQQAALDRDTLAAGLRRQEEQIEQSRQLAIRAIDDLELEEEDYAKARERINLEADIKIWENRLALLEKGSAEYLALENQILQGRTRLNSIGFSFTGRDTETSTERPQRGIGALTGQKSYGQMTPEERAREAFNLGVSSAENLSSTLLGIEQQRIDQQLQLELAAIDEASRRRLEAAGDDALLQKKILLDAERQKLEAEKKAARERKNIAKKEAIIQGALAVVKSLPNPFAVAAAIIATGLQIAVIEKQTFADGGFTGRGGRRDHTGHRVAGVVHNDEWVAPKWMVEDPATAPVIAHLERTRVARRGFADGGFTTASTTPVPAGGAGGGGALMSDPEVKELLRDIRMLVSRWPTTIKADVVLTELETKQAELDYIRGQSVA